MKIQSALILILIFVLVFFEIRGQTVTDIDGNVYQTVTIGKQVWMAENLKTTRYNNGAGILMVVDSSQWSTSQLPGYCWYSNTIIYKNIFGALYNWYAVNTGKLAPEGWHVATDTDWTTLTDFIGGASTAGGLLKSVGTIEVGTSYWYTPNTGASNEFGFSALGGGSRELDGTFNYIFAFGYWWTSTVFDGNFAICRRMNYNYPDVIRGHINLRDGLSVRCVKDTEPGVESLQPANRLRIFPVPAEDFLTIEQPDGISLDVEIINLTGTILLQKNISGITNEINLKILPGGMYIIVVKTAGWQVRRKFIKN